MASRDLGADPFHTLRFVILPAVRPGMLSVLFTLFTMNLADFGTPVVIGGKYKVLATEAYLQAISSADLGKASAISVLLLLPAVAAFWLYGRALSSAGTFSGAGKMQTEWNGDYRLPPVLAYLAADLEAVNTREHDIEDNEVIVRADGLVESFFSVELYLDGVAVRFEIVSLELGYVFFVLDYKNFFAHFYTFS